MQCAVGAVALRRAPAEEADQETQILFGEAFDAYEEKDGWLWGQAVLDSYVGYTRAEAFVPGGAPATHRIGAKLTPLLSAPDVKSAARALLPMNAKLAIAEAGPRFARLVQGGFVFADHLVPAVQAMSDWVSVAENFAGTPYLWGGKTAMGLDCSGLVQTALEAGGMSAPRDTDMMEDALGRPVPEGAPLQRGDLIFWKGHVGAMLDSARLLHANAHFMEVSLEPLHAARTRIAALGGDGAHIRAIKRL